MKIYAIFIEWYNDLGSYKSTWRFSETKEGIYMHIKDIRKSELANARITKHIFEAKEIEEIY